jgi:hypothetical protein
LLNQRVEDELVGGYIKDVRVAALPTELGEDALTIRPELLQSKGVRLFHSWRNISAALQIFGHVILRRRKATAN